MTEKMSENNINLVFAVTNYVLPLYKVNKVHGLSPSKKLFMFILLEKLGHFLDSLPRITVDSSQAQLWDCCLMTLGMLYSLLRRLTR